MNAKSEVAKYSIQISEMFDLCTDMRHHIINSEHENHDLKSRLLPNLHRRQPLRVYIYEATPGVITVIEIRY